MKSKIEKIIAAGFAQDSFTPPSKLIEKQSDRSASGGSGGQHKTSEASASEGGKKDK